jgi:heptosyltransferase-2
MSASTSPTGRGLNRRGQERIERIWVRGTNWIGDAVMTTPALRRLRASFPSAQITLLATPRTAGLFEASAWLDEVIVYRRREDGWRAFVEAVSALRRRGCDLALLFQNAFEAALLARLGGARWRIGFAAQGRRSLLTHALERGSQHRNRQQTFDYLDLVAAAEQAVFGQSLEPPASLEHPPLPALNASAAQLQSAEALLQRHGLQPGARLLVALNAGATNSRAKCWPEDRFAALADRLRDELGAQVILIGAPAERANAERVIAHMRHTGALNLAGDTSIPELIGLLACCDLLVSNDTGPAHIAAALGRPTLTIFGPTNEFETAPLGPQAAILRAEGIECARCLLRECPIDHRCMTRIAAQEVMARARGLLQTADCGSRIAPP